MSSAAASVGTAAFSTSGKSFRVAAGWSKSRVTAMHEASSAMCSMIAAVSELGARDLDFTPSAEPSMPP